MRLGFSPTEATILATAISEMARNVVKFAARGQIAITETRDADRHGVTVSAWWDASFDPEERPESEWREELAEGVMEILPRFALKEGVVAIGEIGLDYHYMHSERATQRAVFERHIELAKSMKKPVIVHNRESTTDLAWDGHALIYENDERLAESEPTA